MKRIIFLSLFIISIVGFNSCKKDTPILGAVVKVTVKNALGIAQGGRTVYMYKDQEVTSSTKPSDAKKQVVTDSNGIAEFDLSFTQFNITESQSTLYFAVFYGSGDDAKIANTSGITIRRDEVKNMDIIIPL